MDKQQQLIEAEALVKKLKKELEDEPITQEIKAKTLVWGKTCEKQLNWENAKEWCKKQGNGWRLPSRIELLQAYEEKVGGFGSGYYWSGSEDSETGGWNQSFGTGSQYYNYKTIASSVRCVKGR